MGVTNVWSNFGETIINPAIPYIALGHLTPEAFLLHYWQKKPLLIRQALPGFQGLLNNEELIQLASNEDVQSRLVSRKNSEWQLKYGPLCARDFSRLSKSKWSLLVQDVNHFLPTAHDLLLKFSFIPYARLDDLMVSYAPPGGGVGPHYDSYDVFLLQGPGRRRWEIAKQYDAKLVDNAPVKILQHFVPEQSWVLEPGDMLYLPPNYAHHGTAIDACMTYSIGFRAPSHEELIAHFLDYLQDDLKTEGWYNDPELSLPARPWDISHDMLKQVRTILNKITWNTSDVASFTGKYMTEPKTHVFFDRPQHPLTYNAFEHTIRKKDIQSNLKNRILTGRKHIFINGESYSVNNSTKKVLFSLIYHRRIHAGSMSRLSIESKKMLYQWYISGYIEIVDHL